MNVFRQGALAGALVIAAGIAPAAVAHGQARDSRDLYARVIDGARGSRIGATVQDLEDEDNKSGAKSGVLVTTVERGGPADKAGIKSGDAITEFDGERVRSVRQFQRLVQESAIGRSLAVVLSRGGQRSTVNLTPEAASFGDGFGLRYLDGSGTLRPSIPAPPTPPQAARAPRPPTPPAFDFFGGDSPLTIIAGRGRLGITMEELTGQLAEYFGVKDGALVKSVQDGSAAAKAGLKAGDVITAINGAHVYDPSDISRAINRMDDGGEFTLDVIRDHKTQTVKGKLESADTRRSRVRVRT